MDVIKATQYYIDRVVSDTKIDGMKALLLDHDTVRACLPGLATPSPPTHFAHTLGVRRFAQKNVISMVYTQSQILEKQGWVSAASCPRRPLTAAHLSWQCTWSRSSERRTSA
jgi:hypothetical protein